MVAGRPGANTKLGAKRVHVVRGRGGNLKFRALRLETGNFAWRSESKWCGSVGSGRTCFIADGVISRHAYTLSLSHVLGSYRARS